MEVVGVVVGIVVRDDKFLVERRRLDETVDPGIVCLPAGHVEPNEGLENALKKPMIFKNPPALSLQIRFFSKYVPNAHFIYIKRDPKFIAQSIYLKRKQIYQDLKHWYSTKPTEYNRLKLEDPIKQIIGQVFYSNLKIESDLSEIPNTNKTIIDYEVFCKNPIDSINSCIKLKNLMTSNIPSESDPLTFEIKDKILVDQQIWDSFGTEFDKLKKG